MWNYGIMRPGARARSGKERACHRCLALYYPLWFVAVVVVMVVSFKRAAATSTTPKYELIFPLTAVTFVAPIFFAVLFSWFIKDPEPPTSPEEMQSPPPPNLHPIFPSRPPSQTISLVCPYWRVYNHDELAAATQNFDQANILGAGGEATVFKGIEAPSETMTRARNIAVKRFYHVTSDPNELEQANAQFKQEVQAVASAISHRNVVEFYGYCIHGRERFLVHELMPKGSLHDWLFAPTHDAPLTWDHRLTIAQDAAHGLDYLHNYSNINLIHLDMKPQNILLDENLNAKVADFGLSKVILRDQTRLPGTLVGGTLGYLPPELNMAVDGWENNITKKADVYSFGIVLLQLVSGRAINDVVTMPPNAAASPLPGLTFRDAAFFLVRTQQTLKLLDTSLAAAANSIVGMKMAEIGANCVEINPMDRPSMRRISEMLDGIG